MKIGVNARFLTKPFTGIGQHTRYLFEALARLYPDVSLILATHEPVTVTMPKNVTVHLLPEKFVGTSGMRKTYWEQRQVPRFFKEQQVDIAHYPYPSNPWTSSDKPVCVTVHDTIPWTSKAYRRSMTTRLYQDSCRFAVKKADHVFTVSEASKHDIIAACHLPDTKISLSYNAPAPQFFQKFPPEGRTKILQKYGLDPQRRYFFYVGGYDERKNVETLISAFEKHIAPYYEMDLVLAGGKAANDPLYASFDDILHRKQNVRPGNIHTTGYIDEQDLPALYQSAFAFVNVSIKEGCNLPLLEALCSGTPVITSDIPVHREMVGHHAVYTGTHDIERLGSLMDQLLRDEQFYLARKEDATRYRSPFSWDQTAKNVYDVYAQLIRRKAVL